jgi:hypothetical protein
VPAGTAWAAGARIQGHISCELPGTDDRQGRFLESLLLLLLFMCFTLEMGLCTKPPHRNQQVLLLLLLSCPAACQTS